MNYGLFKPRAHYSHRRKDGQVKIQGQRTETGEVTLDAERQA